MSSLAAALKICGPLVLEDELLALLDALLQLGQAGDQALLFEFCQLAQTQILLDTVGLKESTKHIVNRVRFLRTNLESNH